LKLISPKHKDTKKKKKKKKKKKEYGTKRHRTLNLSVSLSKTGSVRASGGKNGF
jgi:hypothetical protein